jgi:anti-sigma B factor antagonist
MERRVEPGRAVLALTGELDFATAPDFSQNVLALARERPELLVDVSGVEYIDSTGLRALLLAKRRLRDSRRSLRVVGVRGHVARIVSLAGMERLLADEA